jgi:hypothetical protein
MKLSYRTLTGLADSSIGTSQHGGTGTLMVDSAAAAGVGLTDSAHQTLATVAVKNATIALMAQKFSSIGMWQCGPH